jgi:hypothetical protein
MLRKGGATLNERVKQLRKTLDLTMEKFGEKIGVKKSAISLIESGKNSLTEQMIKSICREFDVDEEWLRNGTGSMFIERTRDEEIANFIGTIQSVDDDSFMKNFISMLAKLDESEWKLLEKMALRLTKENEEDQVSP